MADQGCTGVNRRTFLADVGMGFTGLALGALLNSEGIARASTAGSAAGARGPHHVPRVKTVIWLFMVGGVSHVESFDPKPELTTHGGKTIAESPFAAVEKSPYIKENLREFIAGRKIYPKIFPLQVGYRKRGQSGIEVSDWWPHVGSCVDDLAIVRSMWTTDNDHGAQLQFHTGRHALEGGYPTVGSWIHYGLGTLNENLPQYVVLGNPLADCCGGVMGHGAHYLGPEHSGVRLNVDPANPLPFGSPGTDRFLEEQQAEFSLVERLNRLSGIRYPDDPALRARIKSYELAFRMQTAIPEVMKLNQEEAGLRKLYGLDREVTRPFGELCLAARRLAERGVRFIQVYHGSNGGAGAWDAHRNLRAGHAALCDQVDQPIAALLKDLKRRGMLDETLVVWATEFGRTPGAETGDGRDHHPYGFSVWLAGGGIRGGTVHGSTDELGFHAVEDRHYVTDIHATVLQLLGLDAHRMEIPGRKRLEVDFGEPIRGILS